jgi:acetoin utilization protein AcuB
MSRRPVVVAPGATLGEARDLMFKTDVRHLPVMREDALVGIITNRDILSVLSQCASADRELERSVSEFMTTPVITVSPETLMEDAARLLRKHHIAALPVLRGERMVGIITEGDLLAALVDVASQGNRRVHLELSLPRETAEFERLCEIIRLRGARMHRAERRPRTRERRVDVALDVSTPAIEKLVDSLEDAGYEIELIVYQT